jgi:hypothetical protein
MIIAQHRLAILVAAAIVVVSRLQPECEPLTPEAAPPRATRCCQVVVF